ncbi:MAG: DUF4079 domain-containing protein [Synechococcaceae cyanobacterium]|nr:DUF4079 domain-containing protein [Synechococcaceae cyanobacterium]
MTLIDWLWILHPALMILLAYPLLGGVLLLARRTRQRRLGNSKAIPASSGSEHRDLGRWLTVAVVASVLVALAVVITTHSTGPFPGGLGRLALLGLVALGAATSLAALFRVKQAAYRGVFALLCWIALLGLGSQAEVWRVSDNPFSAGFWQSHYWGGMGLVGLLLFSLASQPEILRHLRWRRWHLLANGLALLIFVAQGISGSRDLLEIPLSWQKPFLVRCDFIQRTCPTPQPPG